MATTSSFASLPWSPSVQRNSCHRLPSIACSVASHTQPTASSSSSARLEAPITRRHIVGDLVSLLAFAIIPAPAKASENLGSAVEYKPYNNELDKYSLLVPPDWVQGQGNATGERNVRAFFPAEDTSANVNVIITGLGPDYTSLGSFGTVDAFAENLVNSLDRSWKRPPGQAAELVNSLSKNGLYYLEYTVRQPGEKKRCLMSVVGIRFNGWYNRLYTVTGQYWEDDKDKYGPIVQKVVNSFTFI